MPVPDFGGLPPFPEFQDITNKINELVQRLRQLLLNLDTLNIRSLNAKVIEAGTITADKMNVNELSAISANLGHITAGLIESVEIYGSYIATRYNSYPRAEMSSDNNLFGAYRDADNSIQIEADFGGSPGVRFIQNGQIRGNMNMLYGDITLEGLNGVTVQALYNSDLRLVVENGNLYVPSFTKVISNNGYNLGVELDGKATAGVSTNLSGSHNHGIPDGTVLRTADGGTVTFSAAPQHSHTQNS